MKAKRVSWCAACHVELLNWTKWLLHEGAQFIVLSISDIQHVVFLFVYSLKYLFRCVRTLSSVLCSLWRHSSFLPFYWVWQPKPFLYVPPSPMVLERPRMERWGRGGEGEGHCTAKETTGSESCSSQLRCCWEWAPSKLLLAMWLIYWEPETNMNKRMRNHIILCSYDSNCIPIGGLGCILYIYVCTKFVLLCLCQWIRGIGTPNAVVPNCTC